MLRGATATREARERLLREARAMARLAHPNVVTVHEVGTADGRDFVAMELIQGETLAQWLRTARRPPATILEAFLAAGRGLAAAHAAGIVHRDFKPHNVLRSRDGRIVVTDFGLAREVDGALPLDLDTTLPVGDELVDPTPLVGITVTGALLGTPGYMAPEQWRGEAVTPRTDQFAYCIALWEALTGERPYRGTTLDELRSQITAGPAALDAARIPRRVRSLLRRGLGPEPSRRWPSMNALLAQLMKLVLEPISTVSGEIDLTGIPDTNSPSCASRSTSRQGCSMRPLRSPRTAVRCDAQCEVMPWARVVLELASSAGGRSARSPGAAYWARGTGRA